MSAVIDSPQPGGWFGFIWREHCGFVVTALLVGISLLIWKIQGGETIFPQGWIEAFPFAEKIDEFDKWIRPYVQPTTRAIGAGARQRGKQQYQRRATTGRFDDHSGRPARFTRSITVAGSKLRRRVVGSGKTNRVSHMHQPCLQPPLKPTCALL